ncbi:MAG: DNA polymerase III subunit delta, partial [Gammaproteobacteria bacterium]
MRLRPEQLAGHLQGGLLPAYLVAGDELLLVQEAADAVRAAARRAGCEERVVLEGGPGCDWARLREEARALSLFASRRLVELRLPSPRPGEAGARALQAWAEDPPPGDVLLVTAPRLDREAQRARWVAALEAAGALVAVWPVERARYPAWVRARLEAAGFRPEPEAVAALAERTEGNLLACAQAVERLALLRPGGGALDEGAVLEAVAGGARYGVFELAERALAGDAAGAARALAALRAEGTEPALVLWAVARELRALLGQSGGRGGPAPRG